MSSLTRHPPDINRTARQALLISILCHLAVINFVVITFKPQPVAARPMFIFLGAFVDLHDFLSLPAKSRTSGGNPNLPLPIPVEKSAFQIPAETAVIKPVFLQDVKKAPKRYIKNDFLKNKTGLPVKEQELKKLGIDPDFPQYIPTKLEAL